MESCSILVSSCDKFKSAWNPFFTLLRKYWPNCPYKLYLNTELLSCEEKDVITLNSKCSDWTGRLKESLIKIDTDFIIFVLEDFFLMDYVNEEGIRNIIEIMKKDLLIAVVYPKKISGYEGRDGEHPEWIRMDVNRESKYLVNCQFAVWNRNAFLEILQPGLSPWQLEREYKVPEECPYKFYCSPYGDKFSIKGDFFPYYFAIQKGYGIAQSKWLWNNKKFFKKENIEVDFSTLGILSYLEYRLKGFWKIIISFRF